MPSQGTTTTRRVLALALIATAIAAVLSGCASSAATCSESVKDSLPRSARSSIEDGTAGRSDFPELVGALSPDCIAWTERDGSFFVYLDGLPGDLDERLHNEGFAPDPDAADQWQKLDGMIETTVYADTLEDQVRWLNVRSLDFCERDPGLDGCNS